MGKNNRQRRAAKQRQRTRERTSAGPRDTRHPGDDPIAAALALADHEIAVTVNRILLHGPDEAGVRAQVAALSRRLDRVPPEVTDAALDGLLHRVLAAAVQRGWGPDDLGELVRRRAGDVHTPVLPPLLRSHAGRHHWVGADWLAEVEDLAARAGGGSPGRSDRLVSRVWVAALLAGAPDVPRTTTAPGARATAERPVASDEERRKLATVRALLAKAESTSYDEEAEALSMKAQELISRYALDRLLDETGSSDPSATRDVTCRRIWLDPPYVLAKAALVHEVADANRCRSAVSEKLGFCSVVGDPRDLAAVELLVTSLLVQASAAMLRHGRQIDRWGQSRTRSFRQSFLLAYAGRIGERLRATTDDLVRTDQRATSLLPALRRQEELVAEAFATLVPRTVRKAASISNGEGWAAGQVAADLARLDVHDQVAARGAS